MKHKVIDNFLDEEYFDSLVTLFTDKEDEGGTGQQVPWYFMTSIAYPKGHEKFLPLRTRDDKLFMMAHMFYDQDVPVSPYYGKLMPILEKLKIKCLIRIKANLYPFTETLYEHTMHIDFEFPHKTALLSLNTCDGYTKFKDGTKIDSVANRVLLFDASKEHCSTNTTNVSARINVNINYH